MISNISNTLSALTAFDKKMRVTANNVANVNTNEFKKSRAILVEEANGGVKADIQKIDTPGIPVKEIKDDQWVDTETSNVDLAEELVETIPTQRAYGANLKMIKTHNEMLGSLLDIMG